MDLDDDYDYEEDFDDDFDSGDDLEDYEVDGQDLEAVIGHFHATNNPAYGSDLYDDVCSVNSIIDSDESPLVAVKRLADVNSPLDLYLLSMETQKDLTEFKILFDHHRDYEWLIEALEQIKKKSKVNVYV